MNFRVLLEHRAERELRELSPVTLKRVNARLESLGSSPRPRGAVKLKGKEGEGWRIRVGDYRILYSIDDEANLVRVYSVKHRRDVYR